MRLTRRALLQGAMAGVAGGTWLSRLSAAEAAWQGKIRIGSCRLDLAQAKQAGLDGVEISVGTAADTLRIADSAVRQQYKDQMRETGLVVSSFMMGLLNSYPQPATPARRPGWSSRSTPPRTSARR